MTSFRGLHTDSTRATVWDSGEPIRAELFSAERLEQHAESLAAAQTVSTRRVRAQPLSSRLRDNGRVLLEAHRAIALAIAEGRAITPAASWLAENYHVIEEQIWQIHDDLPPGYYRQLPKLADGPLAGYPRVLGIAWAFVAHTDSRLDPQELSRFVGAYQRVQPLTIGELWAVVITLRIVLVENLRRAAERIAQRRDARDEADALADRLLAADESATGSPQAILRERSSEPLSTTFAVQLLLRLRDQDPKVAPALSWLDGRLAAQGTTADATVSDEHHRQGASNVTVRNVITSMRAISAVDWSEVFESVSVVDAVLRDASDFAAMDFPTRDRYRAAIEELSRGSGQEELEVARRAVRAAGLATSAPGRDPGYYLIAGGRPAFARSIGYRARWSTLLGRAAAGAGMGGYLAGVALVTAVLLAWPLLSLAAEATDTRTLALLALLGLIPTVEAAIALVNASVVRRLHARSLPALELRAGVPAELRTLVVIPTLLATAESVAADVHRLEVHHLASPDGEIHFALLSDWTDAAAAEVVGDDALLEAASCGIAALNQRYGALPAGDRFVLLHRRRIWNAAQGSWMGWERKRGKLHELNRLLRGATDTSFVAIGGGPPLVPEAVRYVVTLDADTRLPRDAVRRLVGKMAHPINRPRFDPRAGRVVEGYGILQPRVSPSLPMGGAGSVFQRLLSSASGIDPYAAAVSDVYQDLLGEGSYVGKGIYDVDAFEAALAGRVPDNVMLSHDLFEGIFARAGLVSDVEVVEEFPSRYDVATARAHRWARGDWQLLPWLLGRTMHAESWQRGAIPLVGLWKIVDNLRRTLVAPASIVALIVGWTLPLPAAATWTAFLLALLVVPSVPPVLAGLVPGPGRVSVRSSLRALREDLRLALLQAALHVVFLGHQAAVMADAIGRTLFRLAISRRQMLEWVTAAQAQVGPRLGLAGFYGRMWGAVAIGVAVVLLAVTGYIRSALALPFAATWMLSPFLARRISRPPALPAELCVDADDARALRLIARRTWRYFETFVTAADHMLPPDNFQEDPRPVVAHRTSPTNLGLYLLSTVAARDFGWIGTLDMLDRLEATVTEMAALERFRGHFYNWYDTQDLRPLVPKYVSSVDSGNLAAHLITLANACVELIGQSSPLPPLAGVGDALALMRASLPEQAGVANDGRAARARLESDLDALAGMLAKPVATSPAAGVHLAALAALAARVTAGVTAGVTAPADGNAGPNDSGSASWALAVRASIESQVRDLAAASRGESAAADRRLLALADAARTMAQAMRFDFLYDEQRKLLSIGYRVAEGSRDLNCYDLLASEARLASLVAVANGDLPARHWFRLGRSVIAVQGGGALISWSGSMFEYLMPSLVMRSPIGSLLEQTSRLVVRRQQAYGRELGIPWGMSESAYNARDLELTYQYSSFGVPGLGLKRGLAASIVVAPYATALAAMVEPRAAAANFLHLAEAGGDGRYGYYEALDYTPRRLPAGQAVVIVRAYMAHHQGMTIVALADALLNGIMRTRFHAEPRIEATELLLQERAPRILTVARVRIEEAATDVEPEDFIALRPRAIHSPHAATPHTAVLSNGRYSVMVTSAGSGYSRWRDLAVTRWREDPTRDDWGSFVFLRDADGGAVWSAAFQPSGAEPDAYEVTFKEDRAEFVRRDGTVTTRLEVLLSAESDAEVRRVSITNRGTRARRIELTSYCEIVLAAPAADATHPAFSKLFVLTEFVAETGAILATRRRREPGEPEAWAAHLAVVEGETIGELEFETDRARFIGRGRELASAAAMAGPGQLSGTVGTVLDPIFSLRRCVRVAAGATVHVAFWTVVAPTRAEVLDLADKHRDVAAFDRAGTLAWTQAQVQLHHLGIPSDEADLFQRLAGRVLYSDPAARASSQVLVRGQGGLRALWQHGISGDLPIVLVRIDDADDVDIVKQLLRAFRYWRLKQLAADLEILNERGPSYTQDLQSALETLVRPELGRTFAPGAATPGNAFILRSDIISAETRAMLLTAARIVLLSRRGSLAEQLERHELSTPLRPHRAAAPREPASREAPTALPQLEFFNGLGGFAADGQEYVIVLRDGACTPAPWINVIANPGFGFQVAAEGGGNSWAGNSRDNQLTYWSNDPVADRSGEALYVRDDDNGALFGATAQPVRHPTATYVARHGRGYSRFEHSERGIALELLQFVPLDAPLKVSRLTIRNISGRTRHLSVTAYVEWILGTSRGTSAPFIWTGMDSVSGAMLARNLVGSSPSRVAFMDLGGRPLSCTGDRTEFLGRNGALARPAALAGRAALSGRVGAGLDPCGALQTSLELAPGASAEILWLLGEAATTAEARTLIAHWRGADIDASLGMVRQHWSELLGTVEVRTPDRALDILLNGALLYQTLACRIWARSAFYQASGAYGFRDQLQDGMALAIAAPQLTRAHLLRAAGRQFVAGDVQHWWLPETGRGVRTRISDDRAWLCYCTAQYVETTGDLAVLDEEVPFIDGPPLHEGEADNFFQPWSSGASASLYEHCARALERSLAFGAHGLPLIGTGDWNDGMNRVGAGGLGESVWLGWFLHVTLMKFAALADTRGEAARAQQWRGRAAALRAALERDGWDGNWYRRGYFDDGTALGSAANRECRIDSIAQSWAVLSGAGDPQRARRAMAAVDDQLVRRDDGVVLLLAPPFDRSLPDPGYIKAYPPGIRENGGQYTHAAAWSVIAFAMLGDGDKAAELFSMLNPIAKAGTPADAARYAVEPYVVAADVYSMPPHVGRGGWTWYTGSAAWMYRAALEWMLGVRVQGASLLLEPCIPHHWPGFEAAIRYRGARYEIAVLNPAGVNRGLTSLELDGEALPPQPGRVPLVADSGTHRVRAILG